MLIQKIVICILNCILPLKDLINVNRLELILLQMKLNQVNKLIDVKNW